MARLSSPASPRNGPKRAESRRRHLSHLALDLPYPKIITFVLSFLTPADYLRNELSLEMFYKFNWKEQSKKEHYLIALK